MMLSLQCVSAVSPCCPAALAGRGCRGRGWDHPSGSVRDAGSSGTEPVPSSRAPQISAGSFSGWAAALPGYVHSQRQGVALCFEVLPFRIPEPFPKMPAPPQPARSPRQGCPFSTSLVQPRVNPGVGLDCPALCWGAVLLTPTSASQPFPALSLLSLVLQRHRTLIFLQVQ